jgi:hypothetical protein
MVHISLVILYDKTFSMFDQDSHEGDSNRSSSGIARAYITLYCV